MITNGQTILASDFIASSAGAGDASHGVKTGSDGQIDRTFLNKYLKFGGTGSNGALSISSGTTTLDAGGAKVLVKNYTSISITGTAVLTISNPHANGTILVLKSQGNVTITSSANPAIDLRNMGGTAGTSDNNGSYGNGLITGAGGGLKGASGASAGYRYGQYGKGLGAALVTSGKGISVCCGGGGGGGASGNATGGTGGRGGGGLYIECLLDLNITSIINLSGANGSGGSSTGSGSVLNICGGGGGGGNSDGTLGDSLIGLSGGASLYGSGGGGGGGGIGIIVYTTLTSNTGTYTVTGGTGGSAGGSAVGGNGGAGLFAVLSNSDLL